MPCPAMAVRAGMVPSWAGAAGSAGLVEPFADAIVDTIKEKHNNIASPVVRESSLRMWLVPLESLFVKADYILLFKTQAVRDSEQLPSFRMCFRFETFMRIPFLLLVICCSSIFAQQLPPAPKAHVIDVTPNAGYFNEPAIAVNPKGPQQAVVAWQVPASAAYSHDGGETWTIAEGTAPGMYRVSGDVSLAYDAAG